MDTLNTFPPFFKGRQLLWFPVGLSKNGTTSEKKSVLKEKTASLCKLFHFRVAPYWPRRQTINHSLYSHIFLYFWEVPIFSFFFFFFFFFLYFPQKVLLVFEVDAAFRYCVFKVTSKPSPSCRSTVMYHP